MAGIYVHIPFCRQACSYCNFYFTTSQRMRNELVDALVQEAALQQSYLEPGEVETVYLGGGTPSLLTGETLQRLFDALFRHFPIRENAEITLEANPDDLTEEKIRELRTLPVNRLSIGIQSFDDSTLKELNRSHTAEQAVAAVKRVQDAGFQNINVDLLYGLPELSIPKWRETLQRALELQVTHLSCYALTVEPRTALAYRQAAGRWKPADDELAARHLEYLMKAMRQAGWLHYEISNFSCSPQYISRHNSSYWLGTPYLGLGPSAHSYNGHSRQWNVSDVRRYVQAIAAGRIPCEKEILHPHQRISEQLLTRLRTVWGFSLQDVPEDERKKMEMRFVPWVQGGWLIKDQDVLYLTDRGKLIADRIILDLMPDVPDDF
ncbi:MAG: radical SAM family heme chaperone HemW [Chitinophagales bacterium]|nr:radical SAM family heme chaperone HemW [Chitinophagales bacterium]MDW8393829.1 radical SAM family heme chaperone HemW [Chitinophagales bacterium]